MIKLLKAWIRKLKSWLRLNNQLRVENLRLQRALADKDRRIDELLFLADKAAKERHTMTVVIKDPGPWPDVQRALAIHIGNNLIHNGAVNITDPLGTYVAEVEYIKKEVK